jgi:hypothetical protein
MTLRVMRDGCVAVIEAVCGSGARAKDVSDAFGIHAKLGWQIWNVAYSDPFVSFRFLPNDHGVRVWLGASAERGVPAELLKRVEAAIEAVRGVVQVHAEDRETFEMLLDAQTAQPSEEAETKWRRQAFLGNAFTFGARAKTMLATAILFPGSEPNHFSIVRIHGLVGLMRTRADIRWPFAKLIVQQVDRTGTDPGREPLLASTSAGDVPLLTQYCSQPIPEVERYQDGEFLRDELLPTYVGQTGASTIFTGEILHNVAPAHGNEGGEVAHFGTGVRTPCELLISDHIVHRSIFPDAKRELRVYGELISQTTRDDRDRLQVSQSLQHLGQGLLRVRTADVPKYGELLEEAFQRIGLDPNEFDVFRVQLRYPPMPASVMVRHTLPPPPID